MRKNEDIDLAEHTVSKQYRKLQKGQVFTWILIK